MFPFGFENYITRYDKSTFGTRIYHCGEITYALILDFKMSWPKVMICNDVMFANDEIQQEYVYALCESPLVSLEWQNSRVPAEFLLSKESSGKLHILTIHFCDIAGSSVAEPFMQSICSRKRLRSLSLKGNNIGPDLVCQMVPPTKLRVLDLSCNPIGLTGVRHLAYTTHHSITELFLWGVNMDDEGLRTLCDGIESTGCSKKLDVLDISANVFTSLSPLSKIMLHGKLRFLSVADTKIDDIAPVLPASCRLDVLELSRNPQLTDERIMPLFAFHLMDRVDPLNVAFGGTWVSRKMESRFEKLMFDTDFTYLKAASILAISYNSDGNCVLNKYIMRMVCKWLWG